MPFRAYFFYDSQPFVKKTLKIIQRRFGWGRLNLMRDIKLHVGRKKLCKNLFEQSYLSRLNSISEIFRGRFEDCHK